MKNITNIETADEVVSAHGTRFGSRDKPLTPALEPRMGRLGVVATRVAPGQTACPFHTHQLEDEVFFVLSGRGVFRYGETLTELRQGDCVSCPAGSGIAHQLANPFSEDLVYLAIGMNEPNEVCTYPDSGKVMVRALGKVGRLDDTDYWEGEAAIPRIFALAGR